LSHNDSTQDDGTTRKDWCEKMKKRVEKSDNGVRLDSSLREGQSLENGEAGPPRVVNPRTKETFVLIRVEEYERLKEEEYDDSRWTREELQVLAWEMGHGRTRNNGITRNDAFVFTVQFRYSVFFRVPFLRHAP
jgi:hypothetical protein